MFILLCMLLLLRMSIVFVFVRIEGVNIVCYVVAAAVAI